MLFRKVKWDVVARLETKIGVWRQEQGKKKPLNCEWEDKPIFHKIKSKVYLQEGRGVQGGEKTHTIERQIAWYGKSGRDIDTCRCISAQDLH